MFRPDDRPTPAVDHPDGVDYVPMKTWRVFLIQLLNIAGTGPIFGPLMGAMFGPVVFLWIVFGSVLGGAVHDYMCGMISVRMNGASVSEIVGRYLGPAARQIMRVFSVVLLVLTGAVFTTSPAGLLARLTPAWMDTTFWVVVILLYYFLATLLPIDKLIGKLYPVFGVVLLTMALAIVGVVVCPVSSGDTAFRSARLIIADWFHIDQTNLPKRLAVTIPLLAVGTALTQVDFDIIWRYFSWSN